VKTIHLKPARERSLLRRHPWIFSGAVGRVEGGPEGAPTGGETVAVVAADGRWLAWAAFSPDSQIRARVWSWERATPIDRDFFRRRVAEAIARRRSLVPEEDGGALRLVHGEADGLPGVVADRYADTVVVQISAAGPDRWRSAILESIAEATGCRQIYERSDVETRSLEGLAPQVGALAGAVPMRPVEIREHGLRYLVDVVDGQKTGFYLDQRDNRARIRALARDRRVLNCFAYTGGFALAALAGGARAVVSVETSAPALALARQNLALNGLDPARAEWVAADVFQMLRTLRDQGRQFDLIVLDPPKFAPTAAHAERAARAYKDINLWAFKLLAPRGVLATFSCSGGVSPELFQKIVAGAAQDAGADAQILERFQAARDHPVVLSFPEGEYLKGLLLQRP